MHCFLKWHSGDNCKFSHKAPAPKPKAKAEEASTGKPGTVAKAMVALVAASLCTPVIFAGPTYSVDWAADTAAGRHLGPARAGGRAGQGAEQGAGQGPAQGARQGRALSDQGIPRQAFDHFLGASLSLLRFMPEVVFSQVSSFLVLIPTTWMLQIISCWIVAL